MIESEQLLTDLDIISTNNLEKRSCPSCRIYKHINEFYGIRKINTSKCINCNLRASKYVKKKYVPSNNRVGRPFKPDDLE